MHRISSDGAAVVSPVYKWIKIDKDTPIGVTLWLINKKSGVAQKGIYLSSESFFDHWFPLPTFERDTE